MVCQTHISDQVVVLKREDKAVLEYRERVEQKRDNALELWCFNLCVWRSMLWFEKPLKKSPEAPGCISFYISMCSLFNRIWLTETQVM